jgi:hypothetical protein
MAGASTAASFPLAPDALAFLNLVNLLLTPQDSRPAVPQRQNVPKSAAAPEQIAEDIVRSMLAETSSVASRSKSNGKKPVSAKEESERIAPKQPQDSGSGVSTNIFATPPSAPTLIPAAQAQTVGETSTIPAATAPNLGLAVPGDQHVKSTSASSNLDLAFGARLTPKHVDAAATPSPGQTSFPASPPEDAAPSNRDRQPESAPHVTAQQPANPIHAAELAAGLLNHSGTASPAPSSASVPAATPSRGTVAAPPAAPAAPRTAEAIQIAPSTTAAPSHVHEVVVRVAPAGAPPVEVQFNQRQGEVHVTVRTQDQELKTSLRQDLPQLVSALDRAGFHTETFAPRAVTDLAVASPGESSLGNSPQDSSRNPSSGRGAFESDSSAWSGGQQQHQQRQRDQLHQSWLDQMEE